jgi:(p)ppGpp synthase/HD superfamily hydrolase
MKENKPRVAKGVLLNTAIEIAVEAHRGQLDKGGRPYILHPLTVMQLLNTDDEELQCIAVLHDAVEDNRNITWAYLTEKGLTERIVQGVKSVTKVAGETYEEYKAKVKANPDGLRVKMADLTHNTDVRRLKGVRPKDFERMAEYQKFYYELMSMIDPSLNPK